MPSRLRPFVLFAFAAACSAPQPANAPAAGSLEPALQRLLSAPVFAPARVGVLVRDLETGEDLVAHDAQKGFLTASNMKLLSSAVALVSLGADFRFRTRVVASALEDGVVKGDLFLVGDGDPSLGGPPETDAMAPMRALAQQLVARGVRRIEGAVRGDDLAQRFARHGHGWQWDYLADDYAAPCGALNFAQNVLPVRVVSVPRSKFAQVEPMLPVDADWLVPAVFTVPETAPSGSASVRLEPFPHRPHVAVWGGIHPGGEPFVIPVAVPDPAEFAAAAFHAALREAGIECSRIGERGEAPREPVVLAEHVSPPLAELVRPTLVHSINLYAEQLWRTAGHRAADAATNDDLERHAKSVLRELGVDPDGMVLADGSGLSRRSFVQPRHFVALLARARTDERLRPLVDALPVLGRTGTLRSRGRGTAAEGHVHAKTGFVSYVVALSGYVERPDGRAPLAFSILTNQFAGDTDAAKAAVDAFVAELAAHVGWTPPRR